MAAAVVELTDPLSLKLAVAQPEAKRIALAEDDAGDHVQRCPRPERPFSSRNYSSSLRPTRV